MLIKQSSRTFEVTIESNFHWTGMCLMITLASLAVASFAQTSLGVHRPSKSARTKIMPPVIVYNGLQPVIYLDEWAYLPLECLHNTPICELHEEDCPRIDWLVNGTLDEQLQGANPHSRQLTDATVGDYQCIVNTSHGIAFSNITTFHLADNMMTLKSDKTALIGETIVLYCAVKSLSAWEYCTANSSPCIPSDIISSSSFTSSEGMLLLANLTKDDSGIYQCVQQLGESGTLRHLNSVHLEVLDAVEAQPREALLLLYNSSPSVVHANAGERVLLFCLFSPRLKVHWSTASMQLVHNITYYLYFESAKLSDSGTYTCSVERETYISRKITLHIHGMIEVPANQMILQGESGQFLCHSSPAGSSIFWKYNDQIVSSSNYSGIMRSDFDGNLNTNDVLFSNTSSTSHISSKSWLIVQNVQQSASIHCFAMLNDRQFIFSAYLQLIERRLPALPSYVENASAPWREDLSATRLPQPPSPADGTAATTTTTTTMPPPTVMVLVGGHEKRRSTGGRLFWPKWLAAPVAVLLASVMIVLVITACQRRPRHDSSEDRTTRVVFLHGKPLSRGFAEAAEELVISEATSV